MTSQYWEGKNSHRWRNSLEASEEELLHEAGHIAIASVLAASFMVPLSLTRHVFCFGSQKHGHKTWETVSLRDCRTVGFFGVYHPPKGEL